MKRALFLALAVLLAACAPTLQQAGRPDAGFVGPHLEAHRFVSFDGARLGLTRWEAAGGEPWAVVVGLHGMNDYANAFHLAAPYWASQGIATWAYDQRGFGRSPGRGIWAPEDLKTEDLRTLVALARSRYPHALIAVAGESLGGAVVIEAFASDRPPAADRLILLAPAVWGWSTQPLPNKTLLWLAAHAAPADVLTPPAWLTRKVMPTDNRAELIAMSRDPMMIWGARLDTLYGLVTTMERAWREVGEVRAPTLYLYGAHDDIIPKSATRGAVRRLSAAGRTAYYRGGYHLLLRDKQALNVWRDVAAFIADPAAPLPSGAPPIAGARGVVSGARPA
ncbi:MAG: lysophospholipase [Pseudomonadota bacterium]|nr:lysophospholipase [Pseudomonadota bacterium]